MNPVRDPTALFRFAGALVERAERQKQKTEKCTVISMPP
jgi:hypothetical protein